MSRICIKNGLIINEGKSWYGDILIKDGRIENIAKEIDSGEAREIIAEGKLVMPGIIDDQVHFREPGLTYKADIASESRAAIMGGVTTFMEMPNTKPSCLTQELLQDKYDIAAKTAYSNYSFFMGASNDNIEEVLKTDKSKVCGLKIFMGSSTGNMLVDNEQVLENLFSKHDFLIATHCEDEATIRQNMELFQEKNGDGLTAEHHPQIRSREGCLLSSSLAVNLAKKHGTRLHILHISTEDELALFRNDIPLEEKRITAEVCVHHMYFDETMYPDLGNKIKCNPAIKSKQDKEAIFAALLSNKLDIIATDHAPHTKEEKAKPYLNAPSGLPLVQHSLNIMLEFHQQGKISMERVVEKMCHAPAKCFEVKERGFLREGYHADIIIVDPKKTWQVHKENVAYKCGWSPLEGKEFQGKVESTIVGGVEVFDGKETLQGFGERVLFDRS